MQSLVCWKNRSSQLLKYSLLRHAEELGPSKQRRDAASRGNYVCRMRRDASNLLQKQNLDYYPLVSADELCRKRLPGDL